MKIRPPRLDPRARRLKRVTYPAAITAVITACALLSAPGAQAAPQPRHRSATKSASSSGGVVGSKPGGTGTATTDAAQAQGGTTQETAAPSCYAIKKQYPDSKDGVYWLQTPKLVDPQQFYCDMTTDGGGWVLIGRGREGWSFDYSGQGSASQVRNHPSGTDAFKPAALPGDTVDGLLNGDNPTALPDGIRIRRAANSSGTKWQEIRWDLKGEQGWTGWSWAFDANGVSNDRVGRHQVADVKVDGHTFGSGNTFDWSANSSDLTVSTGSSKSTDWKRGFGYGRYMNGGEHNSTDYLWQPSGGAGPLPFTQVFIRPTFTSFNYQSIPSSGLKKDGVRAMESDHTSPFPWGVTGVVGGGSGEENIEVRTLAVYGDTLYVGGKFQYVQKGKSGTKNAQPYIAAFDIKNKTWLTGFRPKLDGQVWKILPVDGKIIIAGEFSNVDGVDNTSGVAALNPTTGKVVSGWRANVTRYKQTMKVRSMTRMGDWLYLGGGFDHVAGGDPVGNRVWVGGAARVKVSDGAPDPNWTPMFDDTPEVVAKSADGSRVYYGGRFYHVDGNGARAIAVLTTSAPATQVSGLDDQDWVSSTNRQGGIYRQAIEETGDRVWISGSEHDIQTYTRAKFDRVTGNIQKRGGDGQALLKVGSVVYAACHCFDFTYNGASNYANPDSDGGWQSAHRIDMIGAFDAESGKYLPNFWLSAASRAGNGVWALAEDNQACLWFGGDVNRGSWASGGYQWLGGFGRLCPTDHTTPTAPTNLQNQATSGGMKLTWDKSTDNSGSVKYEVLRDDRVIAVTSSLSYTDPQNTNGGHTYWVRAVDGNGNRSATTSGVKVPEIATKHAADKHGATTRHTTKHQAKVHHVKQDGARIRSPH